MGEERDFRDVSVDELEVSVRTAMSLQGAGIRTLGELLEYSPEQLRRAHRFDPRSVRELEEMLGDMALALRPG